MIKLDIHTNKYFEELNTSVLNCFPKNGSKKTVLDVGCGLGVLGGVLSKLNYKVTGIENDDEVIRTARTRLDSVIISDLTDYSEIDFTLDNDKFDYIVISDVLEHLYDPFKVVEEYSYFLKPKGKIIVSVPNILVWAFRFKMLFGKFEYMDSGNMDRTHIRFFTLKSIKRLIKAANFKIIKTDYVPYFTRGLRRPFQNLLGMKGYQKLYNFYLKYIYQIEYVLGFCWKQMFGFRIVVMGELKEESNG